jgi:hypothetical protein
MQTLRRLNKRRPDRWNVTVLSLAVALAAAGPAAAQAAHPDFSGLWMLRYDARKVPKAKIRSSRTMNAAKAEEHDLYAGRWCHLVGLPALMDGGGLIEIVQGDKRVAIVNGHVPSHARQIYVDGAHPDLEIFDPQVVGHSVAKWEGDALVVDTIGFSDRGIVSIPGGGWRTPKSKLTERYQLLPDGQSLRVTFTWQDPTVFVAPHTYAFTYVKAPAGWGFATYQCDPSNKDRGDFLIPGSGGFKP